MSVAENRLCRLWLHCQTAHFKSAYPVGAARSRHEIDVYRRGKRPIDDPAAAKAVSHIYDASEVGKQEYDILFITNPTSAHYETLRQWAPYARSVFIEKPVFDDPDQDLSALPLRPDGVYYVACPLRYNPVLQYARERIDMARVFPPGPSAPAICRTGGRGRITAPATAPIRTWAAAWPSIWCMSGTI